MGPKLPADYNVRPRDCQAFDSRQFHVNFMPIPCQFRADFMQKKPTKHAGF
jgi:hypothetical protein